MEQVDAAPGSDGLIHQALFYHGTEDYLARVTDFVQAGLTRAEPAFIAVPGPLGALLRDPLRAGNGQLSYADMAEAGRNPARIIPALWAFLERHPGQRCRVVSEPAWDGRSAAELCETMRHEALVNLAFADSRVSVLCPYPAGLAGRVAGWARSTHPAFVEDGSLTTSVSYAGAGHWPQECDEPLPPPPVSAAVLSYAASLAPVRHLVADQARRGGLPADRAADLVLAASEIAANTLRYTGHGGTLHVWRTASELLCQLRDRGWITDPLAGRRRRPALEPGHGLWLVNQVCDLVELRTGQNGTTVRLHLTLP